TATTSPAPSSTPASSRTCAKPSTGPPTWGPAPGSMIFSRDFTRRLTAAYGTDDELYQLAGARPVSPLDLFDWWLHPHADETAADSDLAQRLGCPIYAIDDETAVRVANGKLDVVTDGAWALL